MHYMMLAHSKAVLAYKKGDYKGKIGIVQSLEYKYPYNENKLEDIIAAKNEDVLQNQFLLDATFLGYYSDETLKIAQKLCALNQGMLDIEESDLEIMKKAAKENDYLGMNYYQSRFIQAYDGENDIHHNGTGEKGTSRFRLKGVGERMNKEGIDRTDWDWLIHPEVCLICLCVLNNNILNIKQFILLKMEWVIKMILKMVLLMIHHVLIM